MAGMSICKIYHMYQIDTRKTILDWQNRVNYTFLTFIMLISLSLIQAGCAGRPAREAARAEEEALARIDASRQRLLGEKEDFQLDSAGERLRERLAVDQYLPATRLVAKEDEDLRLKVVRASARAAEGEEPDAGRALPVTLVDALKIGAANSREYREMKEEVFRRALDLDLQENEFRQSVTGFLSSLASTDMGGEKTVSGSENSASLEWEKKMTTGLALSARLGLDLVKLLTAPRSSSLGIMADASITIPLLRGAGREVVREPLTQAERELVYAIYRFERYKRSFAVQVVSDYLQVIRQLDVIDNEKSNYERLQTLGMMSKRLSEAGRLPDVQVDQAFQNVLQARDRWLVATHQYGRLLDQFKMRLGLPPDAAIEPDPAELTRLAREVAAAETRDGEEATEDEERGFLADMEPVVELALANRLDLRIVHGRLVDSRRRLKVAADDFLPALNLVGSGDMGEGRSLATADLENGRLRPEKGFFSALLQLEWPFNKTAERVAYRRSLLEVGRAERDVDELEDQVKLEVRNRLRQRAEYRGVIRIQEKSVELARRRVESTTLLLKAGRSQMRDLLEAQAALVNAQNNLTTARVNLKISRLELARDTGTLGVSSEGLIESPR